jgi:hypothetical protein
MNGVNRQFWLYCVANDNLYFFEGTPSFKADKTSFTKGSFVGSI